jgi:hypothetical protein
MRHGDNSLKAAWQRADASIERESPSDPGIRSLGPIDPGLG